MKLARHWTWITGYSNIHFLIYQRCPFCPGPVVLSHWSFVYVTILSYSCCGLNFYWTSCDIALRLMPLNPLMLILVKVMPNILLISHTLYRSTFASLTKLVLHYFIHWQFFVLTQLIITCPWTYKNVGCCAFLPFDQWEKESYIFPDWRLMEHGVAKPVPNVTLYTAIIRSPCQAKSGGKKRWRQMTGKVRKNTKIVIIVYQQYI